MHCQQGSSHPFHHGPSAAEYSVFVLHMQVLKFGEVLFKNFISEHSASMLSTTSRTPRPTSFS